MFNTTAAGVVEVRLINPKKGLYENLVAAPLLVIVAWYVELSSKKLTLFGVFNNKLVCVPVIALLGLPYTFAGCTTGKGVEAGVNDPLNNAVPLTNCRLVI